VGPCDVLKAHLIDRPMRRTVTCFPFSRRLPHAIANDRFFCSSSRTTSQHEVSCLRLHRHSWRPWTQNKILPVAKDGVPPSRRQPESFLPLRSLSQRLLLPRDVVRQVWPGWPHALHTQADPEALEIVTIRICRALRGAWCSARPRRLCLLPDDRQRRCTAGGLHA